jgi:peptide/nickel transport system permease protein
MKQLAWRLGQRILLLAGVSLFTFVLLSAAPGNFFDDLKLNPQISPATVSALQAQYGANRPLPERYVRWVESSGVIRSRITARSADWFGSVRETRSC